MRALRPVGLPYSQVLEQFEQENVRSFLVKDGVLQLELYRPLYGESSAICLFRRHRRLPPGHGGAGGPASPKRRAGGI